MIPNCCHLGCEKVAFWQADPEGRPYETTYACDEHLALVLDDGAWRVEPIG